MDCKYEPTAKKLEWANANHNCDIKINQVTQIQSYLFHGTF